MSIKDSPLSKIIYGDGNEVKLPSTRRASFAFYGKEHFLKLLLISLICFAFFVPAIVWMYAANYSKFVAIEALDATAADYIGRYSSVMLSYSLKAYGVLIPLLMFGFIGLAGGFSIIKRIAFNERSNYAAFWQGIKENGLFFAVWGIVFGISVFLLGFDVVYYTVGGLNPMVKGIFIGVAVVQFVLICIVTPYFCTGTVVYGYKLSQALKNSFLLAFSKLFANIAFFALCAAPVIAVLFIPSPFQLIGIGICAVFYLGFCILALTCYCNSVYDKLINPRLGESFVGKGLNRDVKDMTKEQTDIGCTRSMND